MLMKRVFYGALFVISIGCSPSDDTPPPLAGEDEETVLEDSNADSDGDGVIDSSDACPNTPDGIEVDTSGCPVNATAPYQPAPTPTHQANQVISIFSDAYTNTQVDTFLTPWSDASLETFTINGNDMLLYNDLAFAGIETVRQQINATDKTHLHFDYWTADAALIQFKIVDFGANGVYNGVGVQDDVEHEIILENVPQRQWVSVNLALSDFTNLTTRANVAQFIITGEPYGSATVYLDNLYFYGGDDSGGNSGDSNAGDDQDQEIDTSNLELVWSDEFDYEGRPDDTKWYHQTYAPNGGSWFNGELQHYVDDAQTTYVDQGTLKIVARKRNYTTQGVRKDYTSARLNSKVQFQYGRIDVRAKLPAGGGTWPAIWTLGSNINEAGNYFGDQYGSVGWPACGEIDIMEQNGWDKTQTYGYFHWADTQTGNYHNNGTTTYIADSSSRFHLYSLIWDEQVMQIALDDEVFIEMPNDANNPYDNPHYLLLNIAIGGNLGGDVPTNFGTQVMEVDYVRIYQFRD